MSYVYACIRSRRQIIYFAICVSYTYLGDMLAHCHSIKVTGIDKLSGIFKHDKATE